MIDREKEIEHLDRQIATYEARRDELERDYYGRWVVFRDEELVGDYESFAEASDEARRLYGYGSYGYVREVGDAKTLPYAIRRIKSIKKESDRIIATLYDGVYG